MNRFLIAICTLTFAPAAFAAAIPKEAAALPVPAVVEFNRDVRPILSDRCFVCHGPDEAKVKGKLRLDSEARAFAKQGDEATLTPGKPEASELWKRISSADEEERMPPAKVGSSPLKPLSDREKSIIKKWIEQGAKYEGHWAYIKPVERKAPIVDQPGFVRSDIDRFILAKLREHNLAPAKEAHRRTLIRRLAFDLTGLPPTAAQVDAFISDAAPDAYDKVVKQFMDSPHFGERMAIYWLDLVRYADSAGYHSDNDRSVWLYRNYVIDAFNSNKPFDRFTLEQIAGDLLPEANNETLIASGYNRLLNTTQEGGAQAREYIAKYAADRVRNVSTVWLGATLGCAECHDHKYDPLATREFYSMAAFFADVQETPVGNQPQTPIVTAELEEKQKQQDTLIAAIEAKLKADTPALIAAQTAWETQLQKKLLDPAPREDFAWIEDQRTPEGARRDGVFTFIAKGKGPTREGKHSRKQEAGGLVQHFVIDAKATLNLGKEDVFFAWIYLDPKNPPKQIMLQFNEAGSWEHRAVWGEDKIPYGGPGTNADNHRQMGELPKTGEWVKLEVDPKVVGFKEGSVISGMAFTQWDGLAYWENAGVTRAGLGAPDAVIAALKVTADERDAVQKQTLADHYRSSSPLLDPVRKELTQAKATRDAIAKSAPTTLITKAGSPRMMRVLRRGNWLDDGGDVVEPAVPAIFGKLDVTDRRANRLDLAKWLVSEDNPVVARVFVNRLWKLFYGQGLVKTLEDFGSQGDWPSHPQLLDWLANEFIASGWDVKHVVKLMVTSGSYRQTSATTPALRAADPFNRWLARQGRTRFEAEIIRDNALTVSGLLVNDIGGPSVKPYQPASYWQHLNFPKREWKNDSGDGLYRRGLYTWWQRSFLHPSLMAFDASSREEAVCDRVRSNTPLQALVLLNDPTYIEAARVLAERVMKEGGSSDQAKLTFAMRTALQRSPHDDEAPVLLALLSEHRKQFAAEADAAKQLIAIGNRAADKALSAEELAAWTNVMRVLLNLHESVTRE